MAAKKLSEITQGSPNPADFVVGVTAANLDRLFPVSSFTSGSGSPGGLNTDIQFNSSGSFAGTGNLTYTGPTTTGSATNTVGINILGTLNTTGAVDGAAFFANITNTASDPSTTAFDLQVNSGSIFNLDMSGNIFLTGKRAISSSTGLIIEQTGDIHGATAFQLVNDNTLANGAVFSQLGNVSVVDFAFNINGSGGFNGHALIRYERRPTQLIFQAPNPVDTVEFQIGPGWDTANASSFPLLTLGDQSAAICQNVAHPQLVLGAPFLGSGGATVTRSQLILETSGFNWAFRNESTAANFATSLNGIESQIVITNVGQVRFAVGDNAVWTWSPIQYNIASTGGGSALLGGNCPASTLTAPYTWVKTFAPDGSTCYSPIWK